MDLKQPQPLQTLNIAQKSSNPKYIPKLSQTLKIALKSPNSKINPKKTPNLRNSPTLKQPKKTLKIALHSPQSLKTTQKRTPKP